MEVTVSPVSRAGGALEVPGDKSISHRAQLFGAIARGETAISGIADGEDVRSTRRCLEGLGVRFERRGDRLVVHGVGPRGLRPSGTALDCGNSGSTMRMLMGILAGQSFETTLVGDASLSRRPMNRVSDPLGSMGADIRLTDGRFAPLTVRGSRLRGIDYRLPVPSAQVKSALLLAGLYADGITRLTGEIASRDHTERLLPAFGVKLDCTAQAIAVEGGQGLHGTEVVVPGDPSSAAFWAAAACLVPRAEITIRGVCLNPTRTGFFSVLRRMGADIRESLHASAPEPVGDVVVRHAPLSGVAVSPTEVASLIDELPLLAVVAARARGATEVRGAEELRVKETDRIEAVADNVRRLGGTIETFVDGYRVEGVQSWSGGTVDARGDHRIAMAFAIAALVARGDVTIQGADAVGVSYPGFFDRLREVTRA